MQPIIILPVLLFQVGYGTQVGARPFMRLSELTTYPFEAMSVMTGWGATGVWHFSDIDGTQYITAVLMLGTSIDTTL